MIWVKTLPKTGSTEEHWDLLDKFNMVLEDVLADRKGHYIMDLQDALKSNNLFDNLHHLNSHGKNAYWKELDEQIELFEKKKIGL